MTSNLSFAIDLEQLEKEIQQSEHLEGNKTPKVADLSGNIGGKSGSTKVLGNKVQFDCEFDTLDESITDTLNRDLRILYDKFSQVLFPPKNEKNVLADWDLWGPLFICVLLSLLLQGAEKGAQFTQIFSLAFFGSLVVTLNAKLLGGKISFFQSLCVIGYCLLPFIFSSIGIKIVQFLFKKKMRITLVIRLMITVFGLGWASYASTKFMEGSQPPKRKFLSYYPLMLFYFVFAWLKNIFMDAKRIGYVKPDYGLDKERERKLVHVATRGVTQLFNAVAERQTFCKEKLEEMSGKTMKERKRILEELKEYNFENKLNKKEKLFKKSKIKLETKKEEEEEIEDLAISSGVEDTDIEIKEEEEDTD